MDRCVGQRARAAASRRVGVHQRGAVLHLLEPVPVRHLRAHRVVRAPPACRMYTPARQLATHPRHSPPPPLSLLSNRGPAVLCRGTWRMRCESQCGAITPITTRTTGVLQRHLAQLMSCQAAAMGCYARRYERERLRLTAQLRAKQDAERNAKRELDLIARGYHVDPVVAAALPDVPTLQKEISRIQVVTPALRRRRSWLQPSYRIPDVLLHFGGRSHRNVIWPMVSFGAQADVMLTSRAARGVVERQFLGVVERMSGQPFR